MERQNVQSSNIDSIGYDKENLTLEIEFEHGGVYQYNGVPENEYNNLMSANSIGSYFAQNIKNNYQCQKV